MNLKVIVPNLDRRPDRWDMCLQELKNAGFDDSDITRWPAHDGSEWDNVTDALIDVWKYYKGNVPPYLYRENWNVGNYAWSWTWYEILHHIAHAGDGLTLVIQDDFRLNPYSMNGAPIKNVAYLKSILKMLLEESDDFLFLQLFCRAQPSIYAIETRKRRIIPYPQFHPKNSDIYCGTSGSGDAAVVYSASGAQAIMDCANEFPNKATEVVFDYFSETRSQEGCYSTVGQIKENGDHVQFVIPTTQDGEHDGALFSNDRK